jgi:hypothetical protein
VNRMTKRLARIESMCGAGNDTNAVRRLIGISVRHGTDADDGLAALGIVPEPRDLVVALVGPAPSAADQRPCCCGCRRMASIKMQLVGLSTKRRRHSEPEYRDAV